MAQRFRRKKHRRSLSVMDHLTTTLVGHFSWGACEQEFGTPEPGGKPMEDMRDLIHASYVALPDPALDRPPGYIVTREYRTWCR